MTDSDTKAEATTTEIDIADWIRDCIEGSGGLEDYENREIIAWHKPDRIVAAEWIVRCLGNPSNAGAREVVLRLMARHGIEGKMDEGRDGR